MRRWAGVDVGAARKGFHVAVISSGHLPEPPVQLASAKQVSAWLEARQPCVIAVDSPRRPAQPGRRSRLDEVEFARGRICGIRFTPDEEAIRSHARGYYDWIKNGFSLYEELDAAFLRAGWEVIECFPTASLTRLGGPRTTTRAAWSTAVLASLVRDVPSRMSQDARDAVVAALTAEHYGSGRTERFGEIVVPAIPTASS